MRQPFLKLTQEIEAPSLQERNKLLTTERSSSLHEKILQKWNVFDTILTSNAHVQAKSLKIKPTTLRVGAWNVNRDKAGAPIEGVVAN